MKNELELLHRAFSEYRKLTEGNAESVRHRRAISEAGAENDRIESVRSICKIDECWIKEIESGLVYVEKAVREERQFIRSEGEIVPIEKAKRVSKASVAHLARHANMINSVHGKEGVMPEKLYIVEKLSDFAVYENRFLYMLLSYLRDFINLRLEKISELGNTYNGKMHMKKDITIGKRRLQYDMQFTEVSRNDPYSFFDKASLPLIKRIESAQHIVMSLLATPLMEQVSKTPMIKPPITKTNVLKMNTNFKAAVGLYEYVSAFKGAGYTIEEVRKTVNPLPESVADEAAELITLTSFLTYVYGNGVLADLKKAYAAQEQRRKEAEESAFIAKIKSLKRRVSETGQGLEEYTLALEKRNRDLESFSVKITALNKELDSAYAKIDGLTAAITHGGERENLLKNEVDQLGKTISGQLEEIERINIKHAEELSAVKKSAEEEVLVAKLACNVAVKDAQKEADEKKQIYAEENKKIESEKTLIAAQLNGLRQQHGLITAADDFTSKERFAELEKQYDAFGALFEKQWKCVRKNIRKNLLWKNKKDKK